MCEIFSLHTGALQIAWAIASLHELAYIVVRETALIHSCAALQLALCVLWWHLVVVACRYIHLHHSPI